MNNACVDVDGIRNEDGNEHDVADGETNALALGHRAINKTAILFMFLFIVAFSNACYDCYLYCSEPTATRNLHPVM